ncbi:hypothetical protein MNV49_005960 [Pseudohyphozyma bogoriensis]|nr:hypothetical protein MNV49_005960 [Pseudohyphozyma bogoriensis]
MSGPSAEALAEVYASNGPSLAGDFIYFWLYGIATVMACFAVTVSGNLINWSTVAIVVPSQIFFASIAFRSLARNWYFAAFIGLGIGVVTAAGLATCIQLTFLGKTYNSAPLFPNMYLLSLRTSSMTTAIATMNRLESVAGEGLQGQATGNFLAGIVLISLLHTLNSRKSLYHRKNTSQEDHGTSQRGFGKFNRNGTGAGNMARSQVRVDTIVLREMDDGTPASPSSSPSL